MLREIDVPTPARKLIPRFPEWPCWATLAACKRLPRPWCPTAPSVAKTSEACRGTRQRARTCEHLNVHEYTVGMAGRENPVSRSYEIALPPDIVPLHWPRFRVVPPSRSSAKRPLPVRSPALWLATSLFAGALGDGLWQPPSMRRSGRHAGRTTGGPACAT